MITDSHVEAIINSFPLRQARYDWSISPTIRAHQQRGAPSLSARPRRAQPLAPFYNPEWSPGDWTPQARAPDPRRPFDPSMFGLQDVVNAWAALSAADQAAWGPDFYWPGNGRDHFFYVNGLRSHIFGPSTIFTTPPPLPLRAVNLALISWSYTVDAWGVITIDYVINTGATETLFWTYDRIVVLHSRLLYRQGSSARGSPQWWDHTYAGKLSDQPITFTITNHQQLGGYTRDHFTVELHFFGHDGRHDNTQRLRIPLAPWP